MRESNRQDAGDARAKPLSLYLSLVLVAKRVVIGYMRSNLMTVPRKIRRPMEHMRMRAQLSQSVKEGISITRDIALYYLAFAIIRRGFDSSCTLGSQVFQLLESAALT